MKKHIVSISSALVLSLALTAGGVVFFESPSARAATDTWSTVATTGTWSTAANWSDAANSVPATGDSLIFGTSSTTALTDNLMTPATYTLGGITFISGASAYTITPGTAGVNGFTLAGNVINISATTETINDLIAISGTGLFTNTAAGSIVLGGVVSGGGLTETGNGTLTLTGADTYVGATTINGGTLNLGGGTGTGSISASSPLVMGGGTLSFTTTGGATQTFASATINTGASSISNTVNGDTLNLGTLTQVAGSGASVNFVTTGTIGTTTANTNGILGAWATIGNSGAAGATATWAANSGGNTIVAYTGYTALSNGASTSYSNAQLSSTANYLSGISNGNTNATNDVTTLTGTGAVTINSLTQQGDFSIDSNQTLVLGSGGLVFNGISRWLLNNGAGSTAGSGKLTTGLASGELFVDVADNTSDANNWRIWDSIVNNGGTLTMLVKDGPGLLALWNANTYSGGTVVNAGTLSLAFNSGGLGTIRGTLTINSGGTVVTNVANAFGYTVGTRTNVVNINGGVLNANGANGDEGYNTTFNLTGGTLTSNGGVASSTVNSYWDLAQDTVANGGASGVNTFASNVTSLIAGRLIARDDNETSAVFNIASGTTPTGIDLLVSADITGTSITKTGLGTMQLTGTNTYTGTTTVNGGMLQIGNGTSGSLASNALTFGGNGTANFNEAAGSSQAMGALNFSAGDGTVQSTYGGSGTSTLTFSSLAARTAGATGNFVVSGGVNGTTNNVDLTGASAGFISQGDFFGGSNYAWMNGAGTYVRGINYGTANTVSSGDAGAYLSSGAASLTSTSYVEITGTLGAQNTATFITLDDAGSNNVTLASGQTLTVNGILEAGGTSTFSGGTGIQASSGGELVIRTNSAGDSLTISDPILNNSTSSLTKSGAGTLTLTNVNTYTGATIVDNGTLQLTGSASISTGAITVNGGTLAFSGTNSFGGLLGINGGTVSITGGTTTATSAANPNVFVGGNANSFGTMSVASGATFTDNGSNAFVRIGAASESIGLINNAGTMNFAVNGGNFGAANAASGAIYNSGTINQTGAVAAFHGFYMGNSTDSYGYIYNTGTINITSLLGLDRSDGNTNITPASAVIDVTGGTISLPTQTSGNGQGLVINSDATSYSSLGTAELNITGSGNVTVGTTTAGTVTINNSQNTYSSVNVSGASAVFNLAGASGVNLNGSSLATNVSTLSIANGGTVKTSFIQNTGSALSTGVLSFNGGTMVTTATNATGLIQPGVTTLVESGGGTINNNGIATTISGALSAPTGNGLTSIILGGVDTGYIGAPVVVITGGGGTGAAAIANFNPVTGTITGFTISSPGSGYTSAPTITLYGGDGAGYLDGVLNDGAAAGTATADAVIGSVTSGGMTFTGAGVTTLTGANTYTGATAVNNGTLSLTTGSLFGSNVSTSGTAIVSELSTGAIGGAGATFTQGSTGVSTLAGVNTYTGATNINAGTLSVTGTLGSGPVNVNGGGTLYGTGLIGGAVTVAGGSTPSTQGTISLIDNSAVTVLTLNNGLTVGGSAGNSSNLLFEVGTVNSDLINLGGGALTVNAGGASITITSLGVIANSTYNLLDYGSGTGAGFLVGSGTTVDGLTLTDPALSFGVTGVLNVTGTAVQLVTTGAVAPSAAYWTGTVGTATWTGTNAGGGNFTTDAAGQNQVQAYPAAITDVYFAATGATNLTNTLGQNFDIKGLTFLATDAGSNTIGAVSISGSNILQVEGDGITDNNTNGVTLGMGGLVTGTSQTWTNNSTAALTVNAPITGSVLGAAMLTITNTSSGATNLNGVISNGAGGGLSLVINSSGSGVVLLGTANTFTGGVTLTAGNLKLGNASALSSGTVTVNGGTLNLAAVSPTITNLQGSGGVISGTAIDTLTVNGGSYSGAINNGTGTVSLVKATTGNLVLGGSNNFSGGTTINAGTLSIGTIADSGLSNLGNAGTLTVNSGGTFQETGTGSETTARTITLNGGSTILVSSSTGNLTDTGPVTGNSSAAFKSGAGTFTIGGAGADFSLQMDVTGGTLVLATTGGGAHQAVDAITDIGSGDTVKIGSGASGVQFWNGFGGTNLTINSGGTFDLNGVSQTSITAIGGTNGTITNNGGTAATLTTGNNNQTNTFFGLISDGASGAGGMSLIKIGSGYQGVADANTYSGTTTVNAGTLGADAGGNTGATGTITPFGSSNITVNTGGTVELGVDVGTHNYGTFSIGNSITLNGGSVLAFDAFQHLSVGLAVSASGGTIGSTFLDYGALDANGFVKGLFIDGPLTGSGPLTVQQTLYDNNHSYDGSLVYFTNSGVGTYSGTISVSNYNAAAVGNGSYLFLVGNNALADATIDLDLTNGTANAGDNLAGARFGPSTLIFGSGTNANPTSSAYTIGGLAGSAAFMLADTLVTQGGHSTGNAVALTVGGNNTSTTYSGVLSGAGSLIKTGTGQLLLSGASTFTGGVTVQNGIVAVNSVSTGVTPQPLGEASAVSLGVASTSSGILNYTGGIGTLDKNINALGNGADAIENTGSGLLTLSGTLTKNGTVLTLNGGSSGITVSGQIAGSNSGSDLDVTGGVTTLTAQNTYNGPTNVLRGGTLVNGDASGALPSTTALTVGGVDNSSGTFDLGGNNQTVGSLNSAGTGSNLVTNNGASNATITVNSGGAFGGSINDGGTHTTAVAVSGGTLTLSGNSNYSGGTAVSGGGLIVTGQLSGNGAVTVGSGGTLIVSGQLSGSGPVTVNSGGTLGGATVGGFAGDDTGGIINGSVTVNQGGTIAPGAGQAFAGTVMTLNNNLTLGGTANVLINLDSNNNADLLSVGGGVLTLDSLNTDTLTLNVLGTQPGSPTTLTYIIAYYGSLSGGTFGNIVLTGNPATLDSINYDDTVNGPGNDISVTLTLASVPEPGTWAMMLGGMGMLIACQRIRRRRF